MEKFFSPERVVGKFSEEEKKRAIQEKKEVFENQSFEDLRDFELEKSPEILEAINLANNVTNELRVKHGLEEMTIPAGNIHIIKREIADKSPLGSSKACFEFKNQRILMPEMRIENLAHKLIHEMFHMKMQHSFQVDKSGNAAEDRSGFLLHGRKDKNFGFAYFSVLDEAMTEEITRRIVQKEMKNGNLIFKDLSVKTQEAFEKYPDATDFTDKPVFDKDTFYAEVNHESTFMKLLSKLLREKSQPVIACNFGYQREREILDGLMHKLFEKNKDKFNDREEVYSLFEEGFVKGNMFRIGILIDRTFGEGTFRKIGNLTFELNEKEDQREFLESL